MEPFWCWGVPLPITCISFRPRGEHQSIDDVLLPCFLVHCCTSSLLQEGDEVRDLFLSQITFLHHRFIWSSCVWLWHNGNPGDFLCCLLLATFQPKGGISFCIVPFSPPRFPQLVLPLLHQKEICGSIPSVYFRRKYRRKSSFFFSTPVV